MKNDRKVSQVNLKVNGTAVTSTDFFQLSNYGVAINDHAVSLKANGIAVKPNTAINLKSSDALTSDTITLKAGLVKTAPANTAVQAAQSTANLTVAIAYP
ncbi:hypothetical protein B5C26_20025 [Photorhabdus luminescens]|uniref:Fimbrial protein n=1 Tax=Photorhabdus luminescens subsp. mexicana TaxID=2100167 RepID=A0A4R4JMC9_PHOLU|nr:hypothetical protein [Photorhabdus luminescens]OWO79796.1 hypothetical protein B5C26_20025 [Photorhabdus luminescens]TDB55558.1 hypothetical protein C5468_02700 [Photorhabdus luminescens subsp. mexicana]